MRDVNWLSVAQPCSPISATVRIRYRHPGSPAVVAPQADGAAFVEFETPQEAPCPGQAAVFYDGPVVLGGGTIDSVENHS